MLAKGALTSKTSGEGDIRKALVEQGLIDCIVNLPAKLFLNTQIPAALWFMSRNRKGNEFPSNGGRSDVSVPAGRGGEFPSDGGVVADRGGFRNRSNEILFIDARNLGHLINRRTRELSDGSKDPDDNDIAKITSTYHNWRNQFPSNGGRSDVSVVANRGLEFPSIGGVVEDRGGYEDIPGFCASIPISRVAELDYVLTPGRYVGLPDEEDDFNFVERFTALKAELEEQLREEARLNEVIAQNLAKIKLS